MPNSIPKAQLQLQDLSLHDGASVLLRRSLADLAIGDWLEVRGDSPGLPEDLATWCRKEGHQYASFNDGTSRHRIQRGVGTPALVNPGKEVCEVADPAWGLAPRGAKIEHG